MGREILLMPTVSPGGMCSYQSPPLEFFVEFNGMKHRVKGQFILKCVYSKNWPGNGP